MMPTLSRASSLRGRSGVRIASTLIAAALVLPFQVAAQERVAAVFKARDVDFMYRSTTTHLPCHELQGRVARILLAIGARDDIKVQATGCENFLMPSDASYDPFERGASRNDPFGSRDDPFDTRQDRFGTRRNQREEHAHVRVQLMTPVPVTPQVLAEMDKDKSRRELISRVTGDPMVGMNDPVVFPAERQAVTLSRRTIRLEPEDCELLEQMQRSVFRKLDVRVVRGTVNCDRDHPSRIAPQLTVEALLPAGMSQQVPGASQLPAGNEPETPSEPASVPSETQPQQ